jgi:putative salt-induced outer membrane protein
MYRLAGMVAGIAAMTLLAASPAQAEWTGKGELGGVLARGNTDTETLNGKLDMSNELDKWTHQVGFSVLRTVNDGVTSANRWELRGESDYKLTSRSFLFGSLRYEDDQFTDYSHQVTGAVGYGYKFIDNEKTKLDGKLGVGYRQSELRATGRTEDDTILRGMLDYSHQLTETTTVVDKLLVESGSNDTFLQNSLGLQVKMNSSLALGLSYDVRHNTDVLPGTHKTDQVLSANLVFGF